MRQLPVIAILAVATPFPACAGDLALRIVDGAGKPVEDAVVTIRPAGGVPAGPITFPWPNVMVQQNIAFNPHVLIVPVGATVRFPNKDNVRHHVYSFSRPAKFELKLFGKDEARTYVFKTEGAVALGCNIHDTMSGFIKVVDTPFAGKTDGAGQVRIAALPLGTSQVTIWHAAMRAKDNEIVANVPMTSGLVSKTFTVNLRPGG